MHSPLLHYPLKDISNDNLRRLSDAVLQSYCFEGLANFDKEAALENERTDLWSLTDDDNPESLQGVRERRGLGADVQDEELMARVFELENGGLLLANVCRNDADETLIEVFSTEVHDKTFFDNWAGYLKQFFYWANARYFVCWPRVGSEGARQLSEIEGSYMADGFWAGAMKNIPLVQNHALEFRPFSMAEDWEWYEREYQAFLEQNPKFKYIVPISDEEELEEACEEGLCDIALYKGEKLGMVMAESSAELGFDGVMISDIFIASAFRGKGFASSLQRGFLASRNEQFAFVCGYIDARNPASFSNARNQGRALLRQECYIPING
ncbi:hypothetical protein [Pseudoteredinibacter isoporae]|uniref:Putative GNAT family acetyltransferase n=1 Tax=Pseudoteredinibacter isoporae TaxID=570281 RepID=A0A7X0JT84_9GAMM|nr:hypothetical protein [Pseudoteredinibacter isoporae]MBB6521429.1 putative GNAT family acetyltransferase [Pseudoteredinibacter isoporae]NHO86983.1 hypothetical protein [Pseudoteredinibacter isoporae]NIB24564.1 hypothetical protein [Pseudoteredinibacter isoporae]